MPSRFVQAAAAENVSTTLNGAITATATTITVNDASNLRAPCYLIIDRVDAAGTLRATSLWEYVYVSAISGNDLTATRAQGGSTGQSHSNAAVVEPVVTAAAWQDLRLSYLNEHSTEGAHVSAASTNWFETRNLVVPSVASIADLRTGTFSPVNLNVASLASIARAQIIQEAISSIASIQQAHIVNLYNTNATITNSFSVSGASLSGIPWIQTGTANTDVGAVNSGTLLVNLNSAFPDNSYRIFTTLVSLITVGLLSSGSQSASAFFVRITNTDTGVTFAGGTLVGIHWMAVRGAG